MSDEQHFRYSTWVLAVPMVLVLAIWSVYLLELRLGLNLNTWGIYPRTLTGLRGVLASPWIHGSLDHLYNNTLPLGILTATLFYFYRPIAWRTLILGALLTGLLTWCIGRPSYHIGASGIIYLLASFIFFKGVFTRHYRLVALSLGVVFLYGSLLWYVFPIKEGISWEGHLSGALVGFLLAAFFRVRVPVPPKYDWEREDYREEDVPFMRQFDQEGNFIGSPESPDPGSPSSDIAGPDASGPYASGPDASGPYASGPDTSGPDTSGPDTPNVPAPPANPGSRRSPGRATVTYRYHYKPDGPDKRDGQDKPDGQDRPDGAENPKSK